MGRKAKLVSAEYPLETLGLNIDKYYKRMTAQADEMYRKAKWQIEEGGPYESPDLMAMAKAANSTSKQVRSLHYKRWKDHIQGIFDRMSTEFNAPRILYDEATDDQKFTALGSETSGEAKVFVARLAREIYGRSLEVAYMYDLFTAEIDVEEVDPNKKSKKGTTKTQN